MNPYRGIHMFQQFSFLHGILSTRRITDMKQNQPVTFIVRINQNSMKNLSFLTSRGYTAFAQAQDEYGIWYDALEIMDLYIGGEIAHEDNN